MQQVEQRDFSEFLRDKVGPKWVVHRRTPRILQKYGDDVVCLSHKRYLALKAEYDSLAAQEPEPIQEELTWSETLARWNEIVDNCNLSPAGIERAYDFSPSQVKRWLDGDVIPLKKSIARMEKALMKLRHTKCIPFHPSFGYATPEQIARLKESIPQYEREAILKQIEKQTRLRGKID